MNDVMKPWRRLFCQRGLIFLVTSFAGWLGLQGTSESYAQTNHLRVGSAAVNLECTNTMDIGGGIESRFTDEQEGELRAVAVVVELPGQGKLAIVSCDVLFLPRDLIDIACAEIERSTGILPSHVMAHATHTHHAPSVTDVHGSKSSEEFRQVIVKAIIQSVQDANQRLADSRFFFCLSEENTIGGNSRLLLEDGIVTWLNPARESAGKGVPTGPFDPQLPVFDFRDTDGKTQALIYNHSTHTIGTRCGRNVRSASFYGLAAQELEQELGGKVAFLEGASGSTHNITGVPVDEAIKRLKVVIKEARDKAELQPVTRLAAIRRPFKFKVRHFDDAEEDRKILTYTSKYALQGSDVIRKIFSQSRDTMRSHQGEERETYLQAMLIGDVAIVGVPAEYFTLFGVEIKKRSPFKYTYVAELANDWIGYLPDRDGHQLGGYQTWLGLHSYAEIGTGERVADETVKMLGELAQSVAVKNPAEAKQQTAVPKASNDNVASPKSPAEELSSFQLSDPNLKVDLVAAEPDVISPVAMAWDGNGRLFVAEMIGYPQTEGLCRIALLEDRDGDGRYSRTSTFADRLNFVNSVTPFGKGLFATAAPDVLYLEDTDGDGTADIRRVEWTGFATGSQQLRANALHWAIDNFIYGANGRVGGEIHRPDDNSGNVVSIRSRDFRFDPMKGRFEAILGQSQFGQSHDNWGNRFLSWNTTPVRHVLFEEQDVSNYPQAAGSAVINIADPQDTGRIYPISPPPRQFNAEQATYYNAMCGLSIYRGDRLGPDYTSAPNAFICESLTNLITRRVLNSTFPTFESVRAENETNREFLASTDNWCHPVFTTTGPDGGLYFADFYREFVEHPIYVADVKARAETDWRNGSERGRIWRVTSNVAVTNDRSQKEIPRSPRLQKAASHDLVQQLSHPVGWWRDTAQRLLVERQDKSITPQLRALVNGHGSRLERGHALMTLKGLGDLDETTLMRALNDESSELKNLALNAAAGRIRDSEPLQNELLRLVREDFQKSGFRAALALAEVSPEKSAKALVEGLESEHGELLRLAVLCTTAKAPWPLTERFLNQTLDQKSYLGWPHDLLRELAEQISVSDMNQLNLCIQWIVTHSTPELPPCGIPLINGVAHGLETRGLTLQKAAADKESVWHQIQSTLPQLGEAVAKTAGDAKIDPNFRVLAVELLGHLPTTSTQERLLALLDPQQPQAVQTAAARAVSNLDDPSLYIQIFDRWQSLTTTTRRDLLSAMLRTSGSIPTLFDAIGDEKLPQTEVPPHVRDALLQHRVPNLRDRAKQLLGTAVTTDRQDVIDRYLGAVPVHGIAPRGRLLFRQHCANCHAVKGVGQRVGPDLAAVGSRRRDLLIVDILDPSRHVTPDFSAYLAVTRQGKVLVGVIAAETPSSITLKRERGEQETILRADLDELRPTNKSLMPEGLEKFLNPDQLADVLEYLRKPDGY